MRKNLKKCKWCFLRFLQKWSAVTTPAYGTEPFPDMQPCLYIDILLTMAPFCPCSLIKYPWFREPYTTENLKAVPGGYTLLAQPQSLFSIDFENKAQVQITIQNLIFCISRWNYASFIWIFKVNFPSCFRHLSSFFFLFHYSLSSLSFFLSFFSW